MKNRSFVLLASAATVSAGLFGSYAPAHAVGLSGSIGFAGDITVTGIGYCPNTAGPGVVLCTDPAADDEPLTTLDFQKIVTGGPDVFPNGAEVQITGTTGSFSEIDPPPPDFGILEDLGTLPPVAIPIPGGGFSLANFPNPGSPIVNFAQFSDASDPQFRYKFTLASLSFPVYTTSIDPATGDPTTTISLAYSGPIIDVATGMQGLAEGALSADFVGQSAEELQNFFAVPGNVLTDISFSSTLIVTPVMNGVPESSTLIPMLGLGLCGATLIARKERRKK